MRWITCFILGGFCWLVGETTVLAEKLPGLIAEQKFELEKKDFLRRLVRAFEENQAAKYSALFCHRDLNPVFDSQFKQFTVELVNLRLHPNLAEQTPDKPDFMGLKSVFESGFNSLALDVVRHILRHESEIEVGVKSSFPLDHRFLGADGHYYHPNLKPLCYLELVISPNDLKHSLDQANNKVVLPMGLENDELKLIFTG